ncbi:MAG: hypothetical protein ABR581_09370 [Thermoleophilaceae bacterium]
MSPLAIVLTVVVALVLLFLAGGALAARARDRAQQRDFARRVAQADQALEHARAADRGWDREVMEQTVRRAVAEARPGWSFSQLHLVLVEDRPGVDEDRAHFMALGSDGEARVVLARHGEHWGAELVE